MSDSTSPNKKQSDHGKGGAATLPDAELERLVAARLSEGCHLALELLPYMNWDEIFDLQRIIVVNVQEIRDGMAMLQTGSGVVLHVIPLDLQLRLQRYSCRNEYATREFRAKDKLAYGRMFFLGEGRRLEVADVFLEIQNALS
jgi:hypothetical protein